MGGRVWGVVLECTQWHRARRILLRSSFNRAALVHRSDGQDDANDGDEPQEGDDGPEGGDTDLRKEASKTLNATADCYADLQFWGFLGVLFSLGTLLGRLKAWFFCCPCHPKDFCERFDFMSQRRKCHLTGCVAPELAAGDLEAFGEEMANKSFSELEEDLEGLSQGQRDWCLEQWTVGRDYILGEMRLRLRPFGALVLKILCIGLADIRLLRIHLARCILMWDALQDGDVTHPHAIELFSRGSVLRMAVEAVVEGTQDIERVPRLMWHRRRSRLAKCIEVSAERLHAALHRNILAAPHHTGAFASAFSRKDAILGVVQESPEGAQDFGDKVAEVRTAGRVITTLCLQMHPRVEDFLPEGEMPSDFPHKVAVECVYRCDVNSQFRALPNMLGSPPTVPPQDAACAGALQDAPAGDGPHDPPPDAGDDDDPFVDEPPDRPFAAGDGGGGGGGGLMPLFGVGIDDSEEYSPLSPDGGDGPACDGASGGGPAHGNCDLAPAVVAPQVDGDVRATPNLDGDVTPPAGSAPSPEPVSPAGCEASFAGVPHVEPSLPHVANEMAAMEESALDILADVDADVLAAPLDAMAEAAPSHDASAVAVPLHAGDGTDAQIVLAGMLEHHKFEHFKKHNDLTSYYSVRTSSLSCEIPFATLEDAVRPRMNLSSPLMERLQSSDLLIGDVNGGQKPVDPFELLGTAYDWQVQESRGGDGTAAAFASRDMPMDSHLFFRVSNENPRVLAKLDTFSPGDQLVKFMPLHSYDAKSGVFLVAETEDRTQRVLPRANLLSSASAAMAWSKLPAACFYVPGAAVSDSLQSCRALTEMKSVTNATTADDPDDTSFNVPRDYRYAASMDELERADIVVKVAESPTVTSWRWDPAGKKRLQLVWQLSDPMPLCSPHKALSIKDMSVLDLVQCLEDRKWKVNLWNSESKKLMASSRRRFESRLASLTLGGFSPTVQRFRNRTCWQSFNCAI